MAKKDCIAMLLAGGQGSRLYSLTNKIAKPAVHFGSKYRIIDFTLSNCVNSGIDTVGVLTQYQPFELNEYIGKGEPWDLDRTCGGVHILPPYLGGRGGEWYKGTANAIYQNLDFIEKYDPEHVLILSGDHVYKMDYEKMLRFHIEKGADATIAVIDVPLSQASRFGIMSASPDGRITEFEEKPKNPKSTKASMGIYAFSKKVLFDWLERDAKDKKSSNDFGKNVIPAMLASGARLMAYSFSGYWKDVGTVAALWEANMDLLGESPQLDLCDENWKICCRHASKSPHYVGRHASLHNCIAAESCEIEGTVENCVLFDNVKIERNAVVKNSVIMDGTLIKSGARVNYSIVDENAIIGENGVVGCSGEGVFGITVIAADSAVNGNVSVLERRPVQ